MKYSVKYSAFWGLWFVQVNDQDATATKLYATKELAYAELDQMLAEGLIAPGEISYAETCGHGTWLETCREPHGEIRGSLPKGTDR